ncbi:MAG: TetR/AcrR family transcriptional regulator [Bacteroidota bacterium]
MQEKNPELPEEKEHLILTAAQKRFALYGYGKVTMEEIAEDVRMAKASLYYYFPTKEVIFRRVIQREQHEFIGYMTGVLQKTPTASQKLKAYVQHRYSFFDKLLNLHSLSNESWLALKPLYRDLFNVFANEELKLLTQIVHEGKQSGEFNISSPHKTALLLLHVLQGLRVRVFRSTVVTADLRREYDALEKESVCIIRMILTGLKKHN